MSEKMYTLIDANRKPYQSATPGKLGFFANGDCSRLSPVRSMYAQRI
jgi:hypothetical protein